MLAVDTVGYADIANSSYDPAKNLITIFLVQHAGWREDGKKILPTFQKVASELYGTAPVTSGAAVPTNNH